jgi:hypothetical protein
MIRAFIEEAGASAMAHATASKAIFFRCIVPPWQRVFFFWASPIIEPETASFERKPLDSILSKELRLITIVH